jgi:transposase-like protein
MNERISVADAARRLGMNPASLRQAARNGRLEVTIEGAGNRKTFYTTMEAVQRYLDNRPEWVKRREAERDITRPASGTERDE